jgi:antitoxin (DNA-binding transcriptional repressor) of toxin-antitoxin stability system
MEATLPVTEAARNLVAVHRAHYQHEATTLPENGRPVARVVPATGMVKTGKKIAARMISGKRARLTAGEAEAFEADLREARAGMPKPVSPWD